jgi:hypothetical protein
LTLSAPENLLVDRSGFNAFRSGMVAEYKPLAEEGSWLKDDFWKTMAESRDDLLGNFAALGLDQIGQQDQEMLWQAMTPPEHPASVAEMTGNLADTFLICHGSTGKPPIIEEMRIRQTKNKLGEVGAIIYKQPLSGSQKSFFFGHAIGSQPMAR